MSKSGWLDLLNSYGALFDFDFNRFELFDYIGWYSIIKCLLEEFKSQTNIIKIHNMKEKWGELQIYYSFSTSNVESSCCKQQELCDVIYEVERNKCCNIVNFAHKLSQNTCVMCSKYGENKERNGYFLPLCKECEK